MTDISVFEIDSTEALSPSDERTPTTTLLSAMLVVVFPTCFWVSLLELADYALSLGISNVTRFAVAGSLIGLLGLIWGSIVMGARRRRYC